MFYIDKTNIEIRLKLFKQMKRIFIASYFFTTWYFEGSREFLIFGSKVKKYFKKKHNENKNIILQQKEFLEDTKRLYNNIKVLKKYRFQHFLILLEVYNIYCTPEELERGEVES